MNYLGDFAEDETIYTWFTTNDADGGRVAFSAALETADFEVIKDGNATGTTAGITTDEDFDSKTGIHKVTVATTDAFYVTGSDYALLMYPDETVDSQSVAHVVATWSIENRYQMQTGDSFARIGAAGAGLTAIDLPNQTMDITGSLSGSVGSVTGAVGSVTGAVGSVTAGVDLADDAIKAAKFDESTAFPLTAVNGSTLTEAGGTGDHLTDLGGMSTTMKGQVNTEADAALSDYDAPTKTEMDSAFTEIKGATWASGTDTLEHIRNKQTDIEADTNELQTDWANGGRLDLIIDQILADTGTTLDGKIDALNDISEANVLTQVNAALDTAIAELGVAAPTATPSLRTGLMLMYMMARNKVDVDTTGTDAMKIYNDSGTMITSKAITDDGTDYSEAEMS